METMGFAALRGASQPFAATMAAMATIRRQWRQWRHWATLVATMATMGSSGDNEATNNIAHPLRGVGELVSGVRDRVGAVPATRIIR